MNLLSLQDICKQYNHTLLLKYVSLHIHRGERIAVVGKNGSGKSSLLKIIAGELEPDSGERIGLREMKILCLHQKASFLPQTSVQSVIRESMSELESAHKRLEEIHTQFAQQEIENMTNLTDSAHEHAKLTAYLDNCNGWDLQARVDSLLAHFELEEFKDRLVNSLSGGEQKRVSLACLLLQPCDILLLDEPTNHLDVEMVGFLEKFILEHSFTMVFISHDRYFIDKVATRIVEIDEGVLRSFDGGYGEYLRKKEELLCAMSNAHEKLLKILKSEEEWLRKGVKARLKRNEGRKNRILAMRDEAKRNPTLIKKMRLELEREQKRFHRSGEGLNQQKCLFDIECLSKTLGGKKLIENLNLRILRNDKIAIVGKNGSGKSSFLKLLLGEMKPDSGYIRVGDIQIAYFDQHANMLDDSKDLLETFCPNGGDHINVRGKHIHVYGYLKNFLFPKEFLTQKISALSGGERNRVALALLFTKEVDCFILDEPTNDLDIQTINIIEEYLLSLQCAVIFVSHDRYFVDKLAHKLLIFDGQGAVTQTHMSYSQYLDIEEELRELHIYEKQLSTKDLEFKSANTTHDSSPTAALAKEKPMRKKLSYKEKLTLERLPNEISALEERQKQIQSLLSNPNDYQQHGIGALAQELCEIEKELEAKIDEYLKLEMQADI